MPVQRLGDISLFPPSFKTVRVGWRMYYMLTANFDAAAIIRGVRSTGAWIEPDSGSIRRRFFVSWTDLYWTARQFAVPDRRIRTPAQLGRRREGAVPPVVVCPSCDLRLSGENAVNLHESS